MENWIIPKGAMLRPSHVNDPHVNSSPFFMVGSDKWKYDKGLYLAIKQNHGERSAQYYFTEKRHKRLWDLMLNMDGLVCSIVAKYYDFPEPNYWLEFLRFCYNHVASDIKWKSPSSMDQMSLFPYKAIHKKWVEEILHPALKNHADNPTVPFRME